MLWPVATRPSPRARVNPGWINHTTGPGTFAYSYLLEGHKDKAGAGNVTVTDKSLPATQGDVDDIQDSLTAILAAMAALDVRINATAQGDAATTAALEAGAREQSLALANVSAALASLESRVGGLKVPSDLARRSDVSNLASSAEVQAGFKAQETRSSEDSAAVAAAVAPVERVQGSFGILVAVALVGAAAAVWGLSRDWRRERILRSLQDDVQAMATRWDALMDPDMDMDEEPEPTREPMPTPESAPRREPVHDQLGVVEGRQPQETAPVAVEDMPEGPYVRA